MRMRGKNRISEILTYEFTYIFKYNVKFIFKEVQITAFNTLVLIIQFN